MKVERVTRSVASTVLSGWFGFLACILGCAQPTLAASHCDRISGVGLAASSANKDDSASCCNHGRSPSGGSDQNKHSGASCCPLDATFIQKQDSTPPLSGSSHVVVMARVSVDSPNVRFTSGEIRSPTIWYAGRDILLQAHVLRN